MRLYDDIITERKHSFHPTTIHVALLGEYNRIGPVGLAALTLDQGVNTTATLSVTKIKTHRTDDTRIMQSTYIHVMTSTLLRYVGVMTLIIRLTSI